MYDFTSTEIQGIATRLRGWLLAGLLTPLAAVGAPLGVTHFDSPQAAPELDLPALDGSRHALDDYRGQVVVVNFWSTWCMPCREEFPAMQAMARGLDAHGVRFVTVAMGQDASDVNDALPYIDLELPKLLDADGAASEAWQVRALPTTYVVGPDGRLVMRIVGAYDWSDIALRDSIAALAVLPDGIAAR